MLYTHLAAAIVAGALAGWGGWSAQGWRMGEQIATMKAEHSEAISKSEADARIKVQTLNANNAKVTNDYLAEKARSVAAAGRAVASGRLLSEALAAAATTDRNTGTDSGTDDPRGTIASECASALRQVDGYASQLANKTRALQEYASSVCIAK